MKNTDIRAIVFDYGNVIATFDSSRFFSSISKDSRKPIEEIHEMTRNSSDLMEKYETGGITSEEFFEEVKKGCGLRMSRDEFFDVYSFIFTPIKGTLEIIPKLKKNYKVGLISNTCEWHYLSEIKKCEVFGMFDTVSLSFEVGARKPLPVIYRDAVEKLDLKPRECVYIDDIQDFVSAARELGFHAVHYTSHPELINALTELNVRF